MHSDNILEKKVRGNEYLSIFGARSNSNFLTQRSIIETERQDKTEYRLPFQRDRDRIIHSRAFRRLMHKTQVFNANLGDHYRNRLTHTMEVSQIARSISKYLGLNEELTESIAIGHDLGHTPFGHVGERTLHLLISGKMNDSEYNTNNFGGFKHNFQSLQILDNTEKRTDAYNGLNLTLAVREGILKHTSSKIRIPKKNRNLEDSEKDEINYPSLDLSNINIEIHSFTLEGQVVAIADEIAQCTHDLEDGIRANIINLNDLKDNEFIKRILSKNNIEIDQLKETVDVRNKLIANMVGELINDVCHETKKVLCDWDKNKIPQYRDSNDVYKTEVVKFSENIKKLHEELSCLIRDLVIASQQVTQSDIKAEYLIKRLFSAYYNHPQQLPDYILNRYYIKEGETFNRLSIEDNIDDLKQDSEFVRLICDHIGGMTDQYAAREYKKIYEPDFY